MQINVTLLFQAINFCVAFYMLRTYVFKPVLQIITADELVKLNIEREIQSVQEQCEEQYESKRSRWVGIKNKLHDMMPILQIFGQQERMEDDKAFEGLKDQPSLSDQQRINLKKQLSKKLLDL